MRLLLQMLFLMVALCFGAAHAGEVDSNGAITSESDWTADDRVAYVAASRSLTLEELKSWVRSNPNNTFIKSAVYNTKTLNSGQYRTIRERNAYYDYISFIIEGQEFAPPANRDVKFFHATTSVTIQLELGLAESTFLDVVESSFPISARKFGVTSDSLKLISDVNAELFPKNMRIVRDLIFNWQTPLDPRAVSPYDPLSPLDFDLAMVEFEQSNVQAFIDRTAVPNSVLSDVTRMIKSSFSLGLTKQVAPWLGAAGYTTTNFADYRWRVAEGRALVFKFHGKSVDDYVSYMIANPPELRSRKELYSGLMSPQTQTRDSAGSFTILGSWKTKSGAERQVNELRKRFLGIDVVVYPPYGKDKYWTVVSSSFASAQVAGELRREARRLRVSRDAYVLRRAAIDNYGVVFQPDPGSLGLGHAPNLLYAASQDSVPEAASGMVTIFEDADLTRAEKRLSELRSLYPDLSLELVQFKAEGIYGVEFASFATSAQVEQALAIARRIAIPAEAIKVRSITDPLQFEVVGVSRSVQTTWTRVKDCYKSGSVTVEALHACSGYWATPSTLTRCILDSDCRLLDDQTLPTSEQVETFLHNQGLTLGDQIQISDAAIPISKDASVLVRQIQDCRNQAQGDESAFITCMAESVPDASAAAAFKCEQKSHDRDELLTCIADASGHPVLAELTRCTNGDKPDVVAVSRCLVGPAQAAIIDQTSACLESATSQSSALTGCAAALLPPAEKAIMDCLVRSSGDPSGAVGCAIGSSSDKQSAIVALKCAEKSSDGNAVAGCLAGVVDNGAGKVVECVARGGDRAAIIQCMLSDRPEMQRAAKIFSCVSDGTDAASLIAGCADGVVDPRAAQVAACIAQNSSDAEALAGCAASTFVPKELGPVVGCAAQSTGGADFALCMAGPKMNAEWRIAAECAVESGGVPPTFAACTAGRLTIREFTKCLTGSIGKDCFGPNNTIVSAYGTVFHDLEHGLGPNNELVKAGRALEHVVADVGQAAGDLMDSYHRSDVGKALCRVGIC